MKIKFGAIVTDGRGKIGGHVASKNRGGAYLRTKVTPSNPNTVAQTTARSLLGSLSQGWSTLSDTARLAWNGAVNDYAKTDIFGDIKNPSGLNLYVKLNSNLANIGLPVVSVPPAKQEMPSSQLLTAVLDVSSNTLALTFDASMPDYTYVLVRATPAMSAGVSFVKSQLRVIGSNAVTAGIVVFTGDYSSKFGTPAIGQNIVVSAQVVLQSGQKSVAQQIKATIQA